MYICSCGLEVDETKYPKHKQSIRHKHLKRKNKAKHHPFFTNETDETNDNNIISLNSS